ncbi:MAG: DgaE family pyridoxal phosphate-dependent ammonia lyase [Coprobacillaceae bacterium]
MENIYQKYGVKRVINASGKMTILGGSKVNKEVVEAMKEGASNFFEVKDLLNKTGMYIANLLEVEDTYIVNSASGGIAQSIASCITKDNERYLLDIYNQTNLKREVVLCKGHNVDYGTAIEVAVSLGGGKVVEAGYANACKIHHIENQITENTVCLLYVKSHHCVQKGMPSIEDFVMIGKKYNLPVIVDAAAEEDLTKYYNLGVDVVIYSGTKALEGPTSGLLVGKKEFLNEVKKQSLGIGRVMKVGKESILGLTKAITSYIEKEKMTMDEQVNRLLPFNDKINQINGLQAKNVRDGAGREIIRSEISFNETILSMHTKEIVNALKEGEVAIYTREYRANEGKIEIDIRDVSETELEEIYQKLKKIIGGKQ